MWRPESSYPLHSSLPVRGGAGEDGGGGGGGRSGEGGEGRRGGVAQRLTEVGAEDHLVLGGRHSQTLPGGGETV